MRTLYWKQPGISLQEVASKNWSREIKNIYDSLPLLHVVYSGSSMLDLKQGGADLSRRVIEYHLPVWSFREYLNLRCGWQLKTATLDEYNRRVGYSQICTDDYCRHTETKELQYIGIIYIFSPVIT